jgi:hypothetical protein
MKSAVKMERRPQRRSSWFLFTGLVFGLLAGVWYAWYYAPVIYRDAPPALLREMDADGYRSLIAMAYRVNGDRGRAEARLKALGDRDPVEALASQAQRYLGGAGPADEARALADLATVLRQPAPPPLARASTGTPAPTLPEKTALSSTPGVKTTGTVLPTEAATFTPMPTFTQSPSQTPSSTPGAPFAISGQSNLCNPKLTEGLMQVIVEDASGTPVAGVRVAVTWAGGEDFFFTGLAPEINLGYADFAMLPGGVYSVQVGEGGQVASQISAQMCDRPDGSKYLGGVKLRFRQ